MNLSYLSIDQGGSRDVPQAQGGSFHDSQRLLCAAAAVAVLTTPCLAQAQDAISDPGKKAVGSHSNDMVASLAVLNAKGVSLDGSTLTLTGVSPNLIVLADRPVHAAGTF
jgi:hypothetical protein